ncbi:NYN domain-containing protein [Pedococcus sp. KACC 23699]|uniref:NYN domain-containing protein n=1 Tax=Pedococcus sp. KACC 23699 TaxID=3149228 RepID=A0AAU7JX76_9MICO
MDPRARIALLIDADNSSAKKLDLILSELSKLGETSIRRAYGNWTKPGLRPWTEVLHANAILPMQQFDYSRGKNASDMAMVVDAMALLYNDHPDAFGIVSSDADFTPLVMHLRAKGAQVYGFGEAKTPEPFQTACTKFLRLDQLSEPDEEVAEPVGEEAPDAPADGAVPETAASGSASTAAAATTTAKRTTARKKAATAAAAEAARTAPKTAAAAKTAAAKTADTAAPVRRSPSDLKGDARLVRMLRNAAEGAADEEGWARVSTIGQYISNQSSFDSRNYGYGSLIKLLKAIELFEIRDEGKQTLSVRDKRRSKA